MPLAVEAEQLVKRYTGRGETVDAVRGVDLRVAEREVFGFLGPNGAGKSTTVRMLTTLTTITSGMARVAGVDVTGDPDGARRGIGVALQEAGLDSRQTGRELLVDEPTTGLDPASRLTVWEEMRRINKEGTTVFLTTQLSGRGRPPLRPAGDHRRRAHRPGRDTRGAEARAPPAARVGP